MAEGGQRSRSFLDSFSKASGDADETFCDPCKSKGKYKSTEGFCPVCDEYLCENCLEVHRNLKITRAHVILDKNQMPSGQGSVGNQDPCVDVCKTHHPEIIRFFCKAHDIPGCVDCMTLNHTACMKDRIQDISDGYQNTKECKDIDQQLQQLHQQLEAMDGDLDKSLKTLEKTHNQVLQKIATARKNVNDYLDQMEKKVTDEAAQMKKSDDTELTTFKATNQAMKDEIDVMLKTLNASDVNMNSIFIVTKQAKHRLVTMEMEIKHIQQSQQQQQQQYEFQLSNDIEKIVSTKTPLGQLSRRSTQKSRNLTKKQDQATPRTPTIDTTATYNKSIQVKCGTDKKDCYITDCTLLSPDRMVIIDWNNQNVKLIDTSNNTVISTYSTSSAPSNVTVLSTNMIAVTLYVEGTIQVLNVTSTFTLQRKIKINKGCWGIAYKDGKLAVSYRDPGRVDILDIQGKIQHTIQPKQGKEGILQSPRYITFGPDNDTVIVSDWGTKTVSVVTYRGQILRTYKHDTLRCPYGIVITSDGVLFVCSWGNGGCLLVVSPDFKTSKIIVNRVVYPTGITYCEINQTLYISNIHTGDLNNYIRVYDLKEPV